MPMDKVRYPDNWKEIATGVNGPRPQHRFLKAFYRFSYRRPAAIAAGGDQGKKETMAKKKKQKKQKIRIYFLDGKCDTIPQRLWDDYEINHGLFVVKKGGAWIAGYNLDIVACWVVG